MCSVHIDAKSHFYPVKKLSSLFLTYNKWCIESPLSSFRSCSTSSMTKRHCPRVQWWCCWGGIRILTLRISACLSTRKSAGRYPQQTMRRGRETCLWEQTSTRTPCPFYGCTILTTQMKTATASRWMRTGIFGKCKCEYCSVDCYCSCYCFDDYAIW